MFKTKYSKNKNNINYFYCKDLSKKIKLPIVPKVIIHCAGVSKIHNKRVKKNYFNKNVEITNSLINYASDSFQVRCLKNSQILSVEKKKKVK